MSIARWGTESSVTIKPAFEHLPWRVLLLLGKEGILGEAGTNFFFYILWCGSCPSQFWDFQKAVCCQLWTVSIETNLFKKISISLNFSPVCAKWSEGGRRLWMKRSAENNFNTLFCAFQQPVLVFWYELNNLLHLQNHCPVRSLHGYGFLKSHLCPPI